MGEQRQSPRDEGACERFWHGEYAECPYDGGSAEAWEWAQGYEGQAEFEAEPE
jgi:hypothetical protein